MLNTMLKAAHKNIVVQITMAFLVNFLPPNLCFKVMEKKPATMKECIMTARKAQQVIRNKARPVGANAKPRVLAVDEGAATSEV